MLVSIHNNLAFSIADAGRPYPRLPRGVVCVRACDKTGRPLEGVLFRLHLPLTLRKNVTTDANGEARFTDIAPGVYWLTETEPAKGCVRDCKVYSLFLRDNGKCTIDGMDVRNSFFMCSTEPTERVDAYKFMSSKKMLAQMKREIIQITSSASITFKRSGTLKTKNQT